MIKQRSNHNVGGEREGSAPLLLRAYFLAIYQRRFLSLTVNLNVIGL